MRQKKPKPRKKVVVEYPPVPTRKWVPPDRRPKKPRKPAYVKPEGLTQKLEVSSLNKVWHEFRIRDGMAVLSGHFSQTHRRFGPKTSGHQGPSNCYVAVAFSKLYPMEHWRENTIDKILELGDQLYLKSLQRLKDKCKIEILIPEVHNVFYLEKTRIQMALDKAVEGHLLSGSADLITAFAAFFKTNSSGVLESQRKHFAVWKEGHGYFLFDPGERTMLGQRWPDIPGQGFACVVRAPNVAHLAKWVFEALDTRVNSPFELHPCRIARMSQVKTDPPSKVEDLIRKPSIRSVAPVVIEGKPKADVKSLVVVEEEPVVHRPSDAPIAFEEDKNAEAEEFSPDIEESRPQELEIVKPLEELKTESITYFRDLKDENCAILRASCHQGQRKFGKQAGKQSVATSVMALAMLRLHKTKTWIPRILDEIIEEGNRLHVQTVASLGSPEEEPRLQDVPKKITLRDKAFAPDVDEYALIGRLQSTDDEILDLLPALGDFLRDNDTCIVNGPLTLAVWVESGSYYMFDPNERDGEGRAVVKRMTIGSEQMVLDYKPGVACVTRYKNLRDLVDVYFANVDKAARRDQFVLSRVVINDFIFVPDPWYNFQAVECGRWILRGTFDQKSKRFGEQSRDKQGTACATMALAFSTVKHEREWTSDTLDEILTTGDKLYNDTVELLEAKGRFVDEKLMVNEIPRKFPFDENKEVNLEIQDCLVNGLFSARSDDDVLNLRKGLEEFFVDNETGVLTAKSLSVAVWKKDGVYYYYDSHGRDEKGVVNDFGTACVARITNVHDLSRSVETNLPPLPEDTFNISRVAVKVWEMSEDGVPRPPLNNYAEIDSKCSILRSRYHESSEIFGLNRGKQSVPACLAALAMSKIYPPSIWSSDVLDEILKIGDHLYETSMARLLERREEETDETTAASERKSEGGTARSRADTASSVGAASSTRASSVAATNGSVADETEEPPREFEEEIEEVVRAVDAVHSGNVAREFGIGVNRFEAVIDDGTVAGNFEYDLKEAFERHFAGTEEEPLPADASPKALILESNLLVVVLWKEGDVYYLFDPKPRDETGEVCGKDVWSQIAPAPEIEDVEEEEGTYEDEERGGGDADNAELEGSVGSQTEEEDEAKAEAEMARRLALEAAAQEEEERKRREEEERQERVRYWEEQTMAVGKACAMWFTTLDRLIEHLVENTPPTKRHRMGFDLTALEVHHRLKIKEVFDPETSVRVDFYAGDWYDFKEIDHGRWILRGTMDQSNELFPASNRGKQTIPNCYAALAFAYLFTASQFKPETVDGILKYGDRLYTFTKKQRAKELREEKGLGLSPAEIEEIANNETYELTDFPRKFCVGEAMVSVGIAPEFLKGDVRAEEMEDLLGVKDALEKYFSEYKYGIMCAKGNCVAIWRGQKTYYMFDPKPRGPNGVTSPYGKACITRHLRLQTMADVFAKNVPAEGRNEFAVHKVWLERQICERQRQPEPEEEKERPKTDCFKQVTPGKCVLRATVNQNDPRFKKEANLLNAPIAVVALTMTLIHKVQNWSTPLLDEIVEVGNDLYEATADALGLDYNPWEQEMTLGMVKNDFRVGVFRAGCELRHMDQRGIIDIKASHTLNLRQGIEKFFEENTHGVLQTESLTVAIWEDAEDCLIYMFDPNPRGMYGMPDPEGVACLVSFVNAKIASDHIMGVIGDPGLLGGEFVITPVEIVVGDQRTKKKEAKKPKVVTSSLPRCANLVASEKKKRRRRLAELKRQRKEEERRLAFARFKYEELCDMTFILRGLRSQANPYYPESTRNYQDVTNAIAAYVLHLLAPINTWYHEHVDLILDVGNQLYMDSYVVYGPRDRRLGLRDVLRSFWINEVLVNVVIYRPVITERFLHTNVVVAFTNLFQQRNICLFGACDKWVTIVFKSGFYYLFDPRDKDMEGKKVPAGTGSATVVRYGSIGELSSGLMYTLIDDPSDEIGYFSVVLLSVERVETEGKTTNVGAGFRHDDVIRRRCCCDLCA